jgi:hypothetical protein
LSPPAARALPQRVYTPAQVAASWRALQGCIVRVRGVLGYPLTFGWPPFMPKGLPTVYAINGDVVHHGTTSWTPYLPVLAGHEDATLALLRRAHLLAPFLPSSPVTGRPRTKSVQIGRPAGYSCFSYAPCAVGVVLDTPY